MPKSSDPGPSRCASGRSVAGKIAVGEGTVSEEGGRPDDPIGPAVLLLAAFLAHDAVQVCKIAHS